MKISLISGTKTNSVDLSQGNYNGIGRTYKDWAKATGVWDKLSAVEKATATARNVTPMYFTGREIIEQLIRKNAGGIANFIHAISPFNTKGKINATLKAKFDAEKSDIKKRIYDIYPVDENWLKTYASKVNVATGNLPNLNVTTGGFVLTPQQKTWLKNITYRQNALNVAVQKIYKKYPYLIYPAANEKQIAKYREIEINWLKQGGNPDVFNNAVKEGITKSPRSKTFNYLLGKMAQGTFNWKDTGLAARGVFSAIAKGDRFGLGDKDIWTPWNNPKINTKPMGVNGDQKIGEAATITAIVAFIATLPIWSQILITILAVLISGFALVLMIGGKETREGIFGNGNNTSDPLVITDDNGTFNAASDSGNGGTSVMDNLPSWALPLGLGVGAYFLLGDD